MGSYTASSELPLPARFTRNPDPRIKLTAQHQPRRSREDAHLLEHTPPDQPQHRREKRLPHTTRTSTALRHLIYRHPPSQLDFRLHHAPQPLGRRAEPVHDPRPPDVFLTTEYLLLLALGYLREHVQGCARTASSPRATPATWSNYHLGHLDVRLGSRG